MERNHDPDIVSPGRAADAPQGQTRGKVAPAKPFVELERRSLDALRLWLDMHPPISSTGQPMVYISGRPVALDILEVLDILAFRQRIDWNDEKAK